MFISCNWLKRHIDLDGVDLHALGNRFTLGVAELEGIEEVGTNLDHIVIGEVLEVHAIEGAKIRRTMVDVGQGAPVQIVCGAPNVAAGQRVVVALPGAQVGDLKIRVAKLRGVESSGMICSESELGLSEDHAGIMVLNAGGVETPPVGTPLAQAYPVADVLFEIDNKSLTHRPDLWGHRGIAREIAALIGRPLKPLNLDVAFTDAAPLRIEVQDAEACPRYSAVCMDGVEVAPSPLWLRLLLARVGTRPINNVVDATNFVMLDLGNPLHAFDARELQGDAIVVRFAREGEAFKTLDGVEHALTTRDLLIADAERGVALGGVMGGENSEIRDDTTRVVLEAANFEAATIRTTSKRLGIRTESSARFEKSLDPLLVEDASRAFCKLLQELVPSVTITSAFMDVAAPAAPLPVISLRTHRVAQRLGVDLGEDRVVSILEALEFGVVRKGDGVLEVTVPSFRATRDIGIEADLIEEVGRSFGYDNIEPQSPTIRLARPHPNTRKRFERATRNYMSMTAAFDEVMTYSFAHDPFLQKFGAVPAQRVELLNPISAEMPYCRTELVPQLLMVLDRNARAQSELSVYELGRVFLQPSDAKAVPEQPVHLAALVASKSKDLEPAQLFFALKGILSGLSRAAHRPQLHLRAGGVAHPWAHPVRQATISVTREGAPVGYIAELHPRTRQELGFKHEVAFFEFDLDAWRESAVEPPGYTPLPKLPSVFRDFAVLVDMAVTNEAVEDALRAAAPEATRDVRFQSVYRGQGVPEGKKSLAYALTFHNDERTLTDPEVRQLEDAVWRSLAEKVNGIPRA